MKELIKINQGYLLKCYLWISGLFTFGFLLYLYFFFKETPMPWIVIVFFITTIGCPLFIISVWSYDWHRKRKYLNKILSQYPFSALEKIGFTKKTLIGIPNGLRDYVRLAEINGIQIILNVDIKKPNTAAFTTYCNTFILTHEQFAEKKDELQHKNIALDSYTATLKVALDKENLSLQDLETMLWNLTEIVKRNEFEPFPITEWEAL